MVSGMIGFSQYHGNRSEDHSLEGLTNRAVFSRPFGVLVPDGYLRVLPIEGKQKLYGIGASSWPRRPFWPQPRSQRNLIPSVATEPRIVHEPSMHFSRHSAVGMKQPPPCADLHRGKSRVASDAIPGSSPVACRHKGWTTVFLSLRPTAFVKRSRFPDGTTKYTYET